MDGCPEPLEQIFQKVEQESERRAQLAQLDDVDGLSALKVANAATAKRQKERRRGSISISRIGQVSPDDFAAKDPGSRSPSVKAFAPSSPFYKSHVANNSTNSIASGASEFSNAGAHTEDDNHVTQMHHIAGRSSISSKIIPRSLSRSRSASVIPSPGMQNIEANVVIGISVQEAIVESVHEENGGERVVTRSRSASVVARGPVQKQQSQKTLLGSRLKTIGWLSKAKTFTQKIRRKAKVAPPS
ncbi:hypothetical protein BJ912DRAFT_29250 [Pholiota molesta]|nr:hypothetical protein BJ912DRAFT_29250 [Pholiota molesta]